MANQESPTTCLGTGQPLETTLRDLDDEELAEELDGMISENYCGKKYMPSKWMEAYTSEAVVKSILGSRYEPPLVPDLVSYVLHSPAKKLLLLLALCQALHCLPAMKNFGLNDDYLPVTIIRKPGTKGLIRKLGDHEGGRGDFPVPHDWNPSMRGSFERNQWLFLAPVFTEDRFHHELHSDTPLPFLPMETSPQPKLGGFSTVLEVHVDTSHQRVITTYGQPNSSKAALKDLRVGLENYEREKKALEKIRNIDNPHLVKPIASLRLADKSGYFLFPWAEGGNLWNFWGDESNRHGVVQLGDYPKFLWTLNQIHGLCHALVALHNEEDKVSDHRLALRDDGRIRDENGRHGDIKPDNILVFHKAGNPHDTILCIADVGLGKFHAKTTQVRMEGNEITDTKTGTSRYLPPEFDMKTNKQISRLHDVWSLGCVYLEFVVWALWGEPGLKRFQSSSFTQFWQCTNKQKHLHPEVKTWISTITETLSSVEAPTALLDLVQLVGSDMLQLKMSRKKSKDILPKLREILGKAKSDETYCFNPTIQQEAKTITNSNYSNKLRIPIALPEDMSKLEDVWESSSDNNFAKRLYEILRDKVTTEVPSTSSVTRGLCARCLGLDFCKPGFRAFIQTKWKYETCQLCSLLCQAFKTLGYGDGHHDDVEIYRKGSKVLAHTESSDFSILSLYMHPDFTQLPSSDIQLGTPHLPADGSIHQIELFKEWIRTCEESHNHSGSSPGTQLMMSNISNRISTTSQLVDPPTRVIDVRGGIGDKIRLILGKDMQSPVFFALSHRWGDKDEHQVGRTLPCNVKDRFNGINLVELPRNFQEAIMLTKAMGVRYLWIDSLCIIQTDSNDWKREAVRMEQVYSNASCILAASSSNSSIEGFLKKSREKRPYVSVKSLSGRIVYVCKDIDDFHTDVERSILNSRGWVLQERALARRIIHFTKNQAYFECGNGVHCESLMKLNNGKATLLGDSNFPRSAESFNKTGKIVIMQNLYKQYSALGFKFFEDRPVGISGLERRLTSAYDTRGGYGILEAYLERSLLWKRDDARYLERIQFPSGRSLPSWSWMAYSGTITYVEIRFNEVDWTNEYVSPFASLTKISKQHWEATSEDRLPTLDVSKVRPLNPRSSHDQALANISFDVAGAGCAIQDLRCVVLGKHKKAMGITPLPCYVLIVKSGTDPNTVVRIGAGILLEHDICWDLYESKSLN
ncbi:unnamed protein product [Clonostachys byssicola]|uniref:Protein kinase domain-containing protein n=1 Tax=Clonostachys byssicola TaxID=160290 RepID=A0A9N9UY34_9HYPO|nr:unnamed protein product [Clonostachys byssicola]